jgi:hypothetical protein
LPSTAYIGKQAAIFIRECESDDRNISDRCAVFTMRRSPRKARLSSIEKVGNTSQE